MSGGTQLPTTRSRHAAVGLVAACHPLPCLAVTLVTALLGAGVGLSASRVVLLAAAVLTGQLSIGWSNDRIDAARDRAAGRTDKPAATGRVNDALVGVAAAIAFVATVVLSALLGAASGLAALVLVAAGWAYNLGLKGTLWSGATYLVGFGALPCAAYLARPGHAWPPWWVPVIGALLGFAAHFANVLPDLDADAATGVRGLPQRLGRARGVIAMALTLAVASVILGVAPSNASVAFGIVAGALGVLGATAAAVLAIRFPDRPTAFRVTMAVAVLDVVLVVVLSA